MHCLGLSDFVGAFLRTGVPLYSYDSQLTGAHETYIFRYSADLQTIFPLLALVPISIGHNFAQIRLHGSICQFLSVDQRKLTTGLFVAGGGNSTGLPWGVCL